MRRSILKKVIDKVHSIRIGATVVKSRFGFRTYISKRAFVSNSTIGDYTSIGRNTTIINADLGKYCSISWNVTIGATQHPFNRISTHAFSYIKRFGFVNRDERFVLKTKVGSDVWFGANCIVMPGITIGHGAVIGAGAIVTKDVPDYAIVVGSPAKVIRFRFDEEIKDKLLESKWWDLEHNVIKDHIGLWHEKLNEEVVNRLLVVCR
ncbi:MAG: CatB-related O-acetyltransferase [Cyanobacteria bacterium J06632_19]